MQAIHLIIQGKVQGVGYRRWFEQQAIQLGLKGFVRNLETGEVEAIIVGKEAIVRKMIQLSRTGPQRAKVTAIHQQSLKVYPWVVTRKHNLKRNRLTKKVVLKLEALSIVIIIVRKKIMNAVQRNWSKCKVLL